jgi:cell division protein ZapA
MGQVAVTINGRTYTLGCTDGDEARLVELAGFVSGRAEALAEEFRSGSGPIGDDRLLLLTALLIADELRDARESAIAPAPILNGAHAPHGPPPAPEEAGAVRPLLRANGRVAR